MNISKFSLNISRKLGTKLNKTEEEIAVINYGLFAVLQTSLAIILTLIIGFIFGFAIEIITLSISVAVLKRYTGGVHSNTPERCLFMGLFFATGATFLNKNVLANLNEKYLVYGALVILVLSSYILYKKCPVPCENKPLKKESTRKRLRKGCFKVMSINIILLIVIAIIYSLTSIYVLKTISISIILGISIQVFAMTKIGHLFFDLSEKLFNLFKLNRKNQ